FFSAFWILSANSWMQTPTGFRFEHGMFYVSNWLDAIFNPSFPYRLVHMLLASYVTVTFVIAGVSAWFLLNRRQEETARVTFSCAMLAALFVVPLQVIAGDMHGLNTLQYQPVKLAAMEGRWDTERGAPLTLFAIPDMEKEENRYAIEVPKLGSLILR